jgi:hypothetical protein
LAYSLQGPAGNFHDLAEKIKLVSESCADATVLGSFGEVRTEPESIKFHS